MTTNPPPEALIDAHRIKFAGMGMDQLDDAPALDEKKVFTVEATCTAVTRERMKDGEIRHVARMTVDSVWIGDKSDRPAEPPALFPVGDGDGQVGDPDDPFND
jgi:hypothetical protein